jgi:hypothetical protein
VGQGPDGHPPATHEFLAGLKVLAHCLAGIEGLTVETVAADEPWPAGPARLAQADGVVLYLSEGARWSQADPRRNDALGQLAARGGGLVGLHWAIGCKEAAPIEPFLRLLGGCHGGPDRKYQVLETELRPVPVPHPVTRGLAPLRVREELYYRLKFVPGDRPITPLLTAAIDGREVTVCWAWDRPDGGRSFGFSGLHFHDNWRHQAYRRLTAQAVLWSVGLPVPAAGLPVDVPDGLLDLPPR